MKLELISTRRCPFVQRSVITLNYKNIEHKMTFIDLDDPPAWFNEISPLGKVPVLRVDNDAVIFESAVINEFLDDITPGQLHPTDPLQRAINKSWIEFGGNCCSLTFQLMVAPDKQSYDAIVADLSASLGQVENALVQEPYFNGENFSLIRQATENPCLEGKTAGHVGGTASACSRITRLVSTIDREPQCVRTVVAKLSSASAGFCRIMATVAGLEKAG
jgi:hypothetical protein